MPYEIGTANGHYDMLDKLRRFACGYGTAAAPGYTGTGDGTLDAVDTHPATVTETWTIACTDATTPGAEVWSVTGSVSGAQAGATTGVAYDNGLVAFTITAGATDFAVSDQFTLDTTQGDTSASGDAWEELDWDTSTANHFLAIKGHGLSGTDEIFVGFETYQSEPGDYYNLRMDCWTGYNPALSFDEQPGGTASNGEGIPLYQLPLTYWMTVNAQTINVVCKVETVYVPFSVGFLLPYATPAEYPYPVMIAAPLGAPDPIRYSDLSLEMPWQIGGNIVVRRLDGFWFVVRAWPYWNEWWWNDQNYDTHQRDTGGHYPVLPIELYDLDENRYGRLDGLGAVTGFALNAEDTITVGAETWVAFHNFYRTAFEDYFALRLV